MTASQPIKKLLALLDTCENLLLYGLFFALCALTLWQVLLRNLMGISLHWSDDCVRLIVFWLMMAGAMVASRTNAHIKVDLHKNARLASVKLGQKVVHLLTAVICIITAWYSTHLIASEYMVKTTLFLDVPTWAGMLILPVGFILMGLRYFILAFFALNPQQDP